MGQTAPTESERVAFYNSARAELIQRIILRDQMLVAYVVSLGGYLAFLIRLDVSSDDGLFAAAASMLGLPIICMVFSYVVLNHHIMIGKIARYIRRELYPREYSPTHWDWSESLYQDRDHIVDRVVGQASILVLPLLYGVLFVLKNAAVARRSGVSAVVLVAAASLDIAAIVWCAWLHWKAYQLRKRTSR